MRIVNDEDIISELFRFHIASMRRRKSCQCTLGCCCANNKILQKLEMKEILINNENIAFKIKGANELRELYHDG